MGSNRLFRVSVFDGRVRVVDRHALHDAERGHEDDEERAAGADEGQRQAGTEFTYGILDLRISYPIVFQVVINIHSVLSFPFRQQN